MPKRLKNRAYFKRALAVLVILIVATYLVVIFSKVNLLPAETKMSLDMTPYARGDLKETTLPSRKWMSFAMSVVKGENFAPTAAARFYAYVASIYADTISATGDLNQANLATAQIIDVVTPGHKQEVANFLNSFGASNGQIDSKTEQLVNGYLERSKSDGYGLVWDGMTPDGKWYAQSNEVDQGAMAGQWRTWIVPIDEAKINVAELPKEGSLADKLELLKVKYAISKRKAVDFRNVYIWQGAFGASKFGIGENITPSAFWQNILFTEEGNIDNLKYANAQKVLAQSIADSYIAAWKIKYADFGKTPSMRIDHLLTLFADPAYPSYVSGSSAIAATAAEVLTYLFPERKAFWVQGAGDAANAGLLAGVNFDMDIKAGQYVGKTLGQIVVAKLSGKVAAEPKHANNTRGDPFLLFRVAAFELQPILSKWRTDTITFWQGFGHKAQFKNVVAASKISAEGANRGVSWVDFNGDGKEDLMILGEKSYLYKNNGDGTFTDVTKSSKIDFSGTVSAGVFGDYNNDGCPDLYLSKLKGGQNALYKNNCNGTFADVTSKAGVAGAAYKGQGAAWADFDNDGYLDLYATNYGDYKAMGGDGYSQPNFLYHNNRDGTFNEIADKAGVSGVANCGPENTIYDRLGKPNKLSYQPIWFDYNNDGLMDLFVGTDYGVSPLYKNNGDGTFTDVTKIAGLCKRGSNMGVTVGDYDGNGYLDIYTTNAIANYMWRNNGDGTFTEVAAKNGAGGNFSVGWGTGFFDFDNDGNLDIYAVNGIDQVEMLPWNSQIGRLKKDSLYKNNGKGSFSDVAGIEGISDDQAKEAVAFCDYDNNGFVDMAVIGSFRVSNGKVWLYRNKGNSNRWLAVALKATKSNRDSIGALITIKAGGKLQTRVVLAGSSYLGQDCLTQSFGLGRNSQVDELTVRWPSGITRTINNIKADQKITIEEL